MSLNELDKMNRPGSTEQHQPPLMAEDILAKMRMGKRTVSEIRMGTQVIPVRVLSADEVNAIRHEAQAKTARTGGDETDQNLYVQKLTLQLASMVGTSQVPFLSDKIMGHLSVDEIGFLYNELIAFWDHFNPSLEQITQDQFRFLVDALKKNTMSWSDCSLVERKAIFTSFQDMIQRQDIQTSQQVS